MPAATGAGTMNATATQRFVMEKAWPLSLTAILAAGLLLTAFATYRHAKTFSRLPRISLEPEQLTLPLSPRDLVVRHTRWVELKASPAIPSLSEKSVYRNTVESPNSLLLRFKRTPAASQKQTYRGVLVPVLNRTRPGVTPDPFMKEIIDSGIAPMARFAVLLVGESPWQVWLPRIKAIAAIASG